MLNFYRRKLTLFAVAWLNLLASGLILPSQADSEFKAETPVNRLACMGYATWWSHDATGYHPSALVKIENFSGSDLTSQTIRFQSRFVDMSNGEVTVARKEIRQPFKPHQQIYVLLHGPQPFQLSIDDNLWPAIECKVMCRVGDVGDEGTQTLMVTKLESVTMTDDDAFQKISRLTDFSRAAPAPVKGHSDPLPPAKPLAGHAASLPIARPEGRPNQDAERSVMAFLASRQMPGLGDDYYQFERRFGLPVQTDSHDSGWTWAEYKHTRLPLKLVAGSKGRGGKVDVLVLEIPASEVKQETDLLGVARSLSGIFRSQRLPEPSRSVRYLAAGRAELVTAQAPGYQVVYLPPRPSAEGGKSFLLLLCKQPEKIEPLLAEHAKRTSVLKSFAPLFAQD